jgi:AcrR family transcriptional regulator
MTAEAGVTGATKSERTRAAILAAARAQFGLHGYDRTSIRAIAAQAKIDPAMVIRYFTSKEGLFAAAVDVDLRLPDLSGIAADDLGERLTEHFLDRWEGRFGDDVLVILLRSAVTDPSAAERLQSVFIEQVAGALRPLGPPGDGDRRAALVASQLLGVALTRYLLRLPGIADRPRDDLLADLAPTIQRYLIESLR